MASSMLVSVCVITYNSSKFILETLDSIYNQTYDNIQLIVSDDGSKDETAIIVKKWLLEKGGRFVDPLLLTVKSNTGTAANCNRAFRAAKGEWIKDIAGDDVLLPDAIRKYVNFINNKQEIEWCLAKAIFYCDFISEKCVITPPRKNLYEDFKKLNNWDANKQFEKMYLYNNLACPTHFYKRSVFENVGGFNEKWGILEDYPMSLTLLRSGVKCFFVDEYVMGYRYGESNVSANKCRILNKKMKVLEFEIKKSLIFDRCPKVVRAHAYVIYMINMLFSLPILNKRTTLRYTIYRMLISITNRSTICLL